jgi:hypothetical protein
MKGPLYLTRLKVAMRLSLRADGYGFREINDVLAGLDDETVELAAQKAASKLKLKAIPSAPLGGVFSDFFEKLLQSEFGKLLMEFLKQLLLGL